MDRLARGRSNEDMLQLAIQTCYFRYADFNKIRGLFESMSGLWSARWLSKARGKENYPVDYKMGFTYFMTLIANNGAHKPAEGAIVPTARNGE